MTRSDRRLELLGLIASFAILGLVALIRIPNESQWLDEAFTRAAVGDFWGYADSRAGNMFVYMAVVRGFAVVSTDTWWLRMPSLIAAAGTLGLLRPIARRVGGPRIVAVALPTLALLVWFQWAATDARAYSIEILITVAAWLCTLSAMDDDSEANWKWWLLALLGAIGIGVHGFFELQLVPIALVVVLRKGFRRAGRSLWPTVVASAAVLFIFASAGTVDRVGISTTGGFPNWVGETLSVFFSDNPLAKVLLLELVLASVVLAYILVRRKGLRRAWRVLMPLLWMFVPASVLALVSARVDRFSARYVLGSLPGVALVLAVATIWLADKIREKTGPKWQSAFGVVVASVLVVTSIVAPYPWQQNWRGAVEIVANQSRTGDAIVFADDEDQYPEFTRPGFEATWQESPRPIEPTVLSHDRPLGQVRIDDRVLSPTAVASRAHSFDRIWFVQLLTGHDLVDNIDLITGEYGLAGYGPVDQWCFEGGIVVEFWERGVPDAPRPLERTCQ